MPIINYLHTAVVSGYLKKEQWQSWADSIIINSENVNTWIYNVSVAEDVFEVCNAIAYQRTIEPFTIDTIYWEPDVVIGYYYLMYKEGQMTFTDLLNRLVDEDDICSEAEILDTAEMKKILKDVEQGINVCKEIGQLLEPMAQEAKNQYYLLLNFIKN